MQETSSRTHWGHVVLLTALLSIFAGVSVELSVQLSAQVLYRLRAYSCLPVFVSRVLYAARDLGGGRALLFALVPTAIMLFSFIRNWPFLRFLALEFEFLLLVLAAVALVASAALIPFASGSSEAWA